MTDLTETDIDRITSGTHDNPFGLLGLHDMAGKMVLRAFVPDADSIVALDSKTGKTIITLDHVRDGLFEGTAPRRKTHFPYILRITRDDSTWETEDAYAFGPVMGDLDEHLIGEGAHRQLWRVLGAHVMTHEGVAGTHFAVWAPNARRVSVIGHFNTWDGRRNIMRRRGATGVWEIFIPRIGDGEHYKYEIIGQHGELFAAKG